jgi:hypothetical protein
MKYVPLIALIAAIPFTIVAFHDPEMYVRVWSMIGLCISTVASCVAVANMPKENP